MNWGKDGELSWDRLFVEESSGNIQERAANKGLQGRSESPDLEVSLGNHS